MSSVRRITSAFSTSASLDLVVSIFLSHWTVVGKNWKVLSRIGFVEKFVKCMVNSVKAHE